jgi:hypothetical protein
MTESDDATTRASRALQPGARCAKHANRAATGLCARCGDYLCGACGRRVAERLYCADCAARLTAEHSRRATYAFVLGLASIHGLFPLAPVALVISGMELTAIQAGEAPLGGQILARAGLIFALCALAIPIGALLLLWGAR